MSAYFEVLDLKQKQMDCKDQRIELIKSVQFKSAVRTRRPRINGAVDYGSIQYTQTKTDIMIRIWFKTNIIDMINCMFFVTFQITISI